MSYIRIPSGNSSRNENELRSTIDQLKAAQVRLLSISDKMGQMNLDGIARVTAEYNLSSDDDANALLAVVASAAGEQRDSVPFTAQLTSRFG